ncbi:MAG: hypothetical protein INR71_10330 [Terriglobus roseus]|nr:hypothetical protein [Terriglobus roseus]
MSAQASMAGRRTGFLRAMQDRVQLANSAGYEIKSIDAQIVAQQVKIALAEREIANHQAAIDNSREVQEFLSAKYSNVELYAFLEAGGRQLSYQAYTLAYDLARRAEKTFHFEQPAEAARSFISFGYWDPRRDGLMSGESLSIALRQLEAAYQEKRGHDFEVAKSVSLRLLAPVELVRLRETASCEFTVPEVLFDMDFPGHYMRRIRSVSLSIPCVVGPHVGVGATLRLLEHKYRVSSAGADSSSSYPEATDGDGPDPRFATSSVPIAAIATSSAQGDAGVFELNARDERFMPFEGAGAISRWRLSLPSPAGATSTALRPFDYATISDVVLQIRYTALDGGDRLASAAAGAVRAFVQAAEDESSSGDGLYTIFDLRAEFASEWFRFAAPVASQETTNRTLTLRAVADRLPVMTRGAKKLAALSVSLLSSTSLPAAALTLGRAGLATTDPVPFTEADKLGRLFAYSAATDEMEITGDWVLTLKGPDGASVDLQGRGKGIWIVLRYTMKL